MKRAGLRSVALALLMMLLISCGTPARVSRSLAHTGFHGRSKDSSEAMAELIREALRDPGSPASTDALGHFVERWKKERGTDSGLVRSTGGAGLPEVQYRVRFEVRGAGCYPIEYFDQVSPADDYRIKGIKHHMRQGTGSPLAALRENRHQSSVENHYPDEAITRAVTAVIERGPVKSGVQDVNIRLLCPLRNDTVTLAGQARPLAADFSVPWAMLLSRAGDLKRSGVVDAVLTRRPNRKPQLYLMEPYDPDKEPLIMIHGLYSTPLAFADLSNDLWSVDAIRRRYQIWHYLYNTSAPPLYPARILRNHLREIRNLLDPEGNDRAMQKITLLTHSMGGIIGKALVTEPGNAYWDAALTVPHEQLKLSEADRATLNEAFEWKADTRIHRIIFIAVPHRGTDFADTLVGRLGRALTAPPGQFAEFYKRVAAANPGAFTAPYDAMWRGRLDSVGALSPRMPTLEILSKLPFAHPVQVHSIIGNRGRPGPLEQSSDGVVPYKSSHLDGVTSELVVPAGHSAFRNAAAVREIQRILMLP